MIETLEKATPVLNGNKFVSETHVFIEGRGCFYPSVEIADNKSYSYNGVGYWREEIEFEGKTWFKSGYTNCFD